MEFEVNISWALRRPLSETYEDASMNPKELGSIFDDVLLQIRDLLGDSMQRFTRTVAYKKLSLMRAEKEKRPKKEEP